MGIESSVTDITKAVAYDDGINFNLTFSDPIPASGLLVNLEYLSNYELYWSSSDQMVRVLPDNPAQIITIFLDDIEEIEPDGYVTARVLAGENYVPEASQAREVTVTIIDEDRPDGLYIYPITESVEEGQSAIFGINVDQERTQNWAVDIEVENSIGNFLAADNIPTSVPIPANWDVEETFEFEVSTVDNDIQELDGEITVAVVESTQYTIATSFTSASVSITNNDFADGVSILPYQDELTIFDPVQFKIFSSNTVSFDRQINVVISEDGPGYLQQALPEYVTLPAGESSTTISIVPNPNYIDGRSSSVTAQIIPGEHYTVSRENFSAVVTLNDDFNSFVTLVSAPDSVISGGTGKWVFTIDPPNPKEFNFDLLMTFDGQEQSVSVNVPARQTEVSYRVVPFNFNQVSLVIKEGDDYEIYGNPDNEGDTDPVFTNLATATSPVISAVAIKDTIIEGEFAQFEISSYPAPSTDTEVGLSFIESVEVFSLNSLPRSVTLEAGQTSTIVSIQTLDDDERLSGEAEFSLRLASWDGYIRHQQLHSPTVTVIDNDGISSLPVVSIEPLSDSYHWGQNATFEISLSKPLTNSFTVTVQVGVGENSSNREITFAPGITNKLMSYSTLRYGDRDLNTLTLTISESLNYRVADAPLNHAAIDIKDVILSVRASSSEVTAGDGFYIFVESSVELDDNFHFSYKNNLGTFQNYISGSFNQLTTYFSTSFFEVNNTKTFLYTLVDNFGYKIAPEPLNSTLVNLAEPDVSTISVATDLYTLQGEYAGFSITSDQVLNHPVEVEVLVSQTGDVIEGPIPTTTQLAAGDQSKILFINTKNETVDEEVKSISVNLVPSSNYRLNPKNNQATTIVINERNEGSFISQLAINSVNSSQDYGIPTRFLINSQYPLPRDLSVKLAINLDGQISFDEVEFLQGQSSLSYEVTPERYSNANEVRVSIVENTGYSVADSPRNIASTLINKPLIGIRDNNSPTRFIEGGNYEFIVYSSRTVPPDLIVNLKYSTNTFINAHITAEILWGQAEATVQIPQAGLENTTDLTIEVLPGTGYNIAEAPDNQAEVNFTTRIISILTESPVAVRGEPIEFTLVANAPVISDTEIHMVFFEYTNGQNYRRITETINAGQKTKKFVVEPAQYGNAEYISVQLTQNPNYQIQYYDPELGQSLNSQTVNIADVTRPNLTLSTLKNSIREGEDDAIFVINASPPPSEDLMIETDIVYDTTITQRVYYTLPAGHSSIEVAVPVVDDQVTEDRFSITLYLKLRPQYDFFFTEAYRSITVYDNDPPLLDIEYVHQEIVEGENAEFNVIASSLLAEDLPINVRISETGDFILGRALNIITMSAGTEELMISIPTVDDQEFELHGRIFAEIIPGNDYLINDPSNRNWVEVEDNDDRAGAELTALRESIVEGENARFQIYLRDPAPVERRVNLEVSSLSGDFLSDNVRRFVTIPPAVRTQVFSVSTIDDEVFEIDGGVSVSLAPGEGYEINEVLQNAHVVVRDNDAPTGLSIIPRVRSVAEGEVVQFQIFSNNLQETDKTVMLELSQVGSFLTESEGPRTVIIPSGENVGFFDVATTNDEIDEKSGYITATLVSTDDDDIISSANRAVVLVEDDDVPAISIISGNESVNEGNEIRFGLITNQRPVNNVFINVGLSQDGNFVNRFISTTTTMLKAGELETALILRTKDDDVEEYDGLVTATILDGSGYTIGISHINETSVRVIDNDELPIISIHADLATVQEGREGYFTISANRMSAYDQQISIAIADESIDLISGDLPSQVTLEAYTLSTSLNLPIIDDEIYGTTGEIVVSINNGTGYLVSDVANRAEVGIVEDDSPPLISILPQSDEVLEGERAVFVLSAARLSATDVPINIEINSSSSELLDPNYTLVSEVTLEEMTTSVELEIPTADNLVAGDNGTITLSIMASSNYEVSAATNQAEVVIVDDDHNPELSIATSTPNILAGEIGTFQINASNPVDSDRLINVAVQSNFRNLYSDIVQSPVLLPAGTTVVDVAIQPESSGVFGADETVELSLLPGSNYRVSDSLFSATIIVKAENVPQGLSILPINPIVNEGDEVKFQVIYFSRQNVDLSVTLKISELVGNHIIGELPQEIIISSGTSSVIVTIPTIHDNLRHGNGYIKAELVANEDYEIVPAYQAASVVVQNIDVPVIAVSGSGLVVEGSDAVFAVSSSFSPVQDLLVNIQIEDSTGGFLADEPIESVQIDSASSQVDLRVQTDDDLVQEAENGEIQVTILPGTGYVVAESPTNQASIGVIDNDRIQVSLSTESTKVVEGFQVELLLTASKSPLSDLTISMQTELVGEFGYYFASAESSSLSKLEVVIPAGQRHAEFQLGTRDDWLIEPYGFATISLNSTPDYAVNTFANQITLEVIDNDESDQEVSIIAMSDIIQEGEPAIFSIRKSPLITTNLELSLSITGDTGNFLYSDEIEDVLLSTQVYNKFISIETIDDDVAELDGEITVTILSSPDYYVEATNSSATTRILDNDDYQPVVGIFYQGEQEPFGVEGDSIQLQVDLSNQVPPSGLTIPIIIEYLDRDLNIENSITSNLEFLPTEPLSQILELTLVDDGEFKVGRSVRVKIDEGAGYTLASGTSSIKIDIVENLITSSIVQIIPQHESIVEGENAVFRIERSRGDPLNQMEVAIAVTEVGDFVRGLNENTVLFETGQPAVYFAVPTLDDEATEPSGAVRVSLVDGENYQVSQEFNAALIKVQDNDFSPGISVLPVSNSIFEGAIAQFEVITSTLSVNPQQVRLNVHQHGDFLVDNSTSQAVTIAPNHVSTRLNLATLDDQEFEANGTISVSIVDQEGYTVSDSQTSCYYDCF